MLAKGRLDLPPNVLKQVVVGSASEGSPEGWPFHSHLVLKMSAELESALLRHITESVSAGKPATFLFGLYGTSAVSSVMPRRSTHQGTSMTGFYIFGFGVGCDMYIYILK